MTPVQTPARANSTLAAASVREPEEWEPHALSLRALFSGSPSFMARGHLPWRTVQQTRPLPTGAAPTPRVVHRADSVRARGVGGRRRARPGERGRAGP